MVAVLAAARWVISHTRPIDVVVEDDHVALDGVTVPRASVRAARGHTVIRSRFASASFDAIALETPGRQVIVQSMEGTTKPRGVRLRGAAYMVPADDFDRLAGALGVG